MKFISAALKWVCEPGKPLKLFFQKGRRLCIPRKRDKGEPDWQGFRNAPATRATVRLRAPLLIAASLILALIPSGRSQVALEMKGFSVQEHYDPPFEKQTKSDLKAATARQLSGGLFLLTDMVVRTFRETGEGELVVKAPHCVYNSDTRAASSADELRMETADGRFSITGQGFRWDQKNDSLVISNQVHTVIQPELFEAAVLGGRTNAGAAQNPATPTPGETEPGIHVFSDHFSYGAASGQDAHSGLGIYQGSVRVSGTNLNLTASTLTVEVPVAGPNAPAQLKTLTADRDVVVDYLMPERPGQPPAKIHATGQHGVYSAQTGLLRMSGHPAWQTEQREGLREGRGDELLIDRTNKIFAAIGQAWLKLPGQTLGHSGLVPNLQTNEAPAAPGTNQFVEISCDHYEIRTNWAVFRSHVRTQEYSNGRPRSQMTCSLMTATFGGSNQLERLDAETNVLINQDDKQLAGQKAIYTGADGVLELTGNPSWKAGDREGRGGLVQVFERNAEMLVRTNAYMRLPASELAQPQTLGAAMPAAKPPGPDVTNNFAEIFCDGYRLQTNTAVYEGGVYVSHPNMNWACERLTASIGAAEQAKSLVAEQAVTFDLRDERGELHGVGDRAVYTFNVVGERTNDLMRLTGDPAVLQTTNGMIRNDLIILDRAANEMMAPGDYRVFIKTHSTNTFSMPRSRFFK